MKIAEIRFLQKGEAVSLPPWTGFLTEKMRQKYILKYRPFTLREEGEWLRGVLSVEGGEGMTLSWREKSEEMLKTLAAEGAGIAIAPYEGEFPRKILPFAEGKVLTRLYAFDGVAEALKRQGKNPAEASFLIAGGEKESLSLVLSGMGNEVNRLAFFTDDPSALEEIREELYEERGLLSDVFTSPRNPLFGEADGVIVCGMEQTGYEHILKRNAVFLDTAGNRPALRRLRERRWDTVAAEGFFFLHNGEQMEGRKAEALAFRENEEFRQFWLSGFPAEEGARTLLALKEGGVLLSGFSALGKRVKIAKNQG